MKTIKSFKQKHIGLIFMFLHCIFISVSTILLKLIQSHYNILQIIFSYNFLICLSLGAISLYSKSRLLKISFHNIGYHFIRSIFGFSGFILFFYAICNMNIAEARAIIAIDPIITSLLAIFFFKESMDINKMLASSITFIGAMILLHPSNLKLSSASIAAFFAAIFFGIFNNITKKVTTGKTIEQMFYLSFFSAIYSLIPSVYNWNNTLWSKHVCVIVLIACTFTLSSFSAFNAFKRTELTLLMPMHFIGMIATSIMGYIVFDEIPGYLTILGSFIIIIGTIPVVKLSSKL